MTELNIESIGEVESASDGYPWKRVAVFGYAPHPIADIPNGTKVYAEPHVIAEIERLRAELAAARELLAECRDIMEATSHGPPIDGDMRSRIDQAMGSDAARRAE